MSIGKYLASLTLVGVVGLIILNPRGFTAAITIVGNAVTGGIRVASGGRQP